MIDLAVRSGTLGQGRPQESLIDETHRWSAWAAPKDAEGKFDHNSALTGDDLIDYVNQELFPYLQGFRRSRK